VAYVLDAGFKGDWSMTGLFDEDKGESKSTVLTVVQKQEYDAIDRLVKLAELKDRGLISDMEFSRAKDKLGLGPTDDEKVMKVLKLGGVAALLAFALYAMGQK
jgi:hypothetical protein